MIVSELMKVLESYPPNMRVFIDDEYGRRAPSPEIGERLYDCFDGRILGPVADNDSWNQYREQLFSGLFL